MIEEQHNDLGGLSDGRKAMKVLVDGKSGAKAWWIGGEPQCRSCGLRVRLEEGDDAHCDWIPVAENTHVKVRCLNCGDVMKWTRILHPNKASSEVTP